MPRRYFLEGGVIVNLLEKGIRPEPITFSIGPVAGLVRFLRHHPGRRGKFAF